MRGVRSAWLILGLAACDAPAHEAAPPESPPASSPASPPAVAEARPEPAAPVVVSPRPEGREERRQATRALLVGGGVAATLPLVDTSPGREFDRELAYKLTPKENLLIGGTRVPTVRQAKSTVTGPLDKDLIRRAVRENINDVRHCYDEGLAVEPRLKGRVVVEFTILGDGEVGESKIVESTMDDWDVETCIRTAVLSWKFPKPDGGATVTVAYPFVLEPG